MVDIRESNLLRGTTTSPFPYLRIRLYSDKNAYLLFSKPIGYVRDYWYVVCCLFTIARFLSNYMTKVLHFLLFFFGHADNKTFLDVVCYSRVLIFYAAWRRKTYVIRKVPTTIINPRRAAARRLARRAGGGGVWTLTQLLSHVASRGKRHSKERQKAWRNCFGHFLGQVKSQVTRGNQRSNFAFFNIFLF